MRCNFCSTDTSSDNLYLFEKRIKNNEIENVEYDK